MKTMICLILDRSGSMAPRRMDVIGGVNTFIEEQKQQPDPATIALVRFDDQELARFRPMQNLDEVKPLTADEYQPRGGTPLLDAVGVTITALDEDWKREQPERCIVVIVTDGQENASREFTKEKVKVLIEARQDSGKWAFIYLGANVDAFAEGGSMGIAFANTANYVATAAGMSATYGKMSETISKMRATGATLSDDLGGDIKEDGTVDKKQQTPPPTATAKTQAWTTPKPAGPWTPPV